MTLYNNFWLKRVGLFSEDYCTTWGVETGNESIRVGNRDWEGVHKGWE